MAHVLAPAQTASWAWGRAPSPSLEPRPSLPPPVSVPGRCCAHGHPAREPGPPSPPPRARTARAARGGRRARAAGGLLRRGRARCPPGLACPLSRNGAAGWPEAGLAGHGPPSRCAPGHASLARFYQVAVRPRSPRQPMTRSGLLPRPLAAPRHPSSRLTASLFPPVRAGGLRCGVRRRGLRLQLLFK